MNGKLLLHTVATASLHWKNFFCMLRETYEEDNHG